MELLTSGFRTVGGAAPNHQTRDQKKEHVQDEDCLHGLSGEEQNLRGYHKGIKKITCLGSGFVGGVYDIT